METEELDTEERAHMEEMASLAEKYGMKPESQEPSDKPESSEDKGEKQEATEENPSDNPPTGEDEVADSRKGDSDELLRAEQRVKDAQARMTRATQEAAEFRRQIEELQQEIVQLRTQIDQQKNQAQVDTGNQTDIDMDSLEGDEYLAPLAKLTKAQLVEMEQSKKRIAQLEKHFETAAAREQRQAADAHSQAILSAHPDVYEVSQSPEFREWLDTQPPAVQRIVQDGSAPDVNYMLSQFKGRNGVKEARSERQRDAAKAAAVPNVRGQAPGQRSSGAEKVPFWKIKDLPNSEILKKYPDENQIDWSAVTPS